MDNGLFTIQMEKTELNKTFCQHLHFCHFGEIKKEPRTPDRNVGYQYVEVLNIFF